MVGWLVGLFYGVSALFGSFNADLSHFDKSQTVHFSISTLLFTQLNVEAVLFQTIQFSISTFFVYTQLNRKTANFKQFSFT